MWDSTSRHCFSGCRHLTAHLYTFVRCLVEIWRYLSWPKPRDASKFSSAFRSSCFGHLGCRTFQQFSELRWTLMKRQGQSRWIWQFDCSYLFFHIYIYIYYRDQTWSNKVIHIHHSPLHCCCATPCIALPQLYSLAPYELSLKHHEAPYSWNWFPWLRRRLLPFWPLFSCGPHVQIRTAGRTKPVVLKDGVLSESTWVYLALPCLPSSFMYRICPLCLGFAQVGHVGPFPSWICRDRS